MHQDGPWLPSLPQSDTTPVRPVLEYLQSVDPAHYSWLCSVIDELRRCVRAFAPRSCRADRSWISTYRGVVEFAYSRLPHFDRLMILRVAVPPPSPKSAVVVLLPLPVVVEAPPAAGCRLPGLGTALVGSFGSPHSAGRRIVRDREWLAADFLRSHVPRCLFSDTIRNGANAPTYLENDMYTLNSRSSNIASASRPAFIFDAAVPAFTSRISALEYALERARPPAGLLGCCPSSLPGKYLTTLSFKARVPGGAQRLHAGRAISPP